MNTCQYRACLSDTTLLVELMFHVYDFRNCCVLACRVVVLCLYVCALIRSLVVLLPSTLFYLWRQNTKALVCIVKKRSISQYIAYEDMTRKWHIFIEWLLHPTSDGISWPQIDYLMVSNLGNCHAQLFFAPRPNFSMDSLICLISLSVLSS